MTSAPIERVDTRVFRLATEDGPESDGTAVWDATTMVLAEVRAGGVTGIGYSYVDRAAATAIASLLAPAITGQDAFSIPAARAAMLRAIRNHGRPGVVACAISAVDVALWDLKAKLLGVALADLLGAARVGGAGLRQRRLHVVGTGAAGARAGRLSRRRPPPREDQGGAHAGRRHRARARGARCRGHRHRAHGRRQRRL